MSNKSSTYPETPTLEKMKSVSEDSQKIGEFLDWLREEGISLCKYHDDEEQDYREQYFPISESFEKLLAKYYGVNLEDAEKERCAILEHIRSKG